MVWEPIVEDCPFSEDDRFSRLCRQQNDVISRDQALRLFTPEQVRHRLNSGRWKRLGSGVYLTRSGAAGEDERRWAAVLLAGWSADKRICLGGLTALQVWGLRRITSPAIHVLVPHDRRAQGPRGTVIHRTRHPPDVEDTRLRRPPSTLPGRSLVDAAQWARSDREATLIVASCFQQGLVNLREVERACELRPNTPRRRLVLSTAADCAGGSHSLGELDVVRLCRRRKLPTPTRQVRRVDRQGRTRYLDALFEEYKLALEIDGVHHWEVDQMWDDAERQNSLALDGYVVLRFPASMVRDDPDRVAAAIREALVRAGWRG